MPTFNDSGDNAKRTENWRAIERALNDRVVPWTSYVPAWTTDIGQPSIGNGTLLAAFDRRDNRVSLRLWVALGSTTNGGTGTWAFELPYPAHESVEQHGVAKIYSPGGSFAGLTHVGGGASVFNLLLPNSPTDLTLGFGRNADVTGAPGTGVPVIGGHYTLENGSNLAAAITYEMA